MNNVTNINEAKKQQKKEEYQKFKGDVAMSEHNDILQYDNCYYIVESKEECNYETQITDFTIDIKQFVQFKESQFSELKIVFSNSKGRIVERTLKAADLTDVKTFKKALSKVDIDFNFVGHDKYYKFLRQHMSNQEFDRKIGVEKIGMFKTKKGNFIAFDTETNINNKGETSNKYVVSDTFKEIESTLISNECVMDHELDQISNSMFKFNHINKCVAIWGFVAACFLKSKLNDNKIKLPHLQLIGEAGSGKSATLENIIMKCFDMDKNNTLSASGITKFTLTKLLASSNLVPGIIEEYKPYQLKKFEADLISSYLRSAYDGHAIKRGRADQSVLTYMLSAPVIVLGECGFDETAIQDRSHVLEFSKVFHNETCKDHFDFLKRNEDILKKFGKSLLVAALKMSEDEIVRLYNEHLANLKELEFNSRQIEGIAVMCVGYDLIEKVYPDIYGHVDKNKLYGFFSDEKEAKTKSIVENTLEIYDRIGTLQKGWHYDVKDTRDGGKCFVLDVKNTYDTLTQYCSNHNLKDEILTRQQFTKQLGNSKYFVKYSNCKMRIAYDSTAGTAEKNDSLVAKRCYFLKYDMLKDLEMYNLIENEEDEDEFII